MKNIIEMREKRMNLVNQAREILDRAENEKRNPNAEEETQYNKIMADVENLRKEIEREEKLQDVEREMSQSLGTVAGGKGQPAAGQPQSTNPRASEEYRAVFNRYLVGGISALNPTEIKNLQATNDPEGGFTIAPEQFINELLKAVDNMVFIRQWARKFTLTTSTSLGVPTLETNPNDFDWTSEIAAVNEDTAMTFGKRALTPHPLSKLIKVSNKLLRVSSQNPEQIVRDRMAYIYGLTHEKAFLTGNGVNQPLGVFTASTDGISTSRDVSDGNTTTSIGFDGLKSAKYALKQQYLRNAKWLFHRDGVAQIDKLKDANGQYLWQPSVQIGEPDRLLNIPVYMSEYVPNTFTTGQYVGMLADFSFYWIVDSLEFAIQRLVELYAGNNQVGFIGRGETDGMPTLEEAFVRVKLA